MSLTWKQSALQSLLLLDEWRESNGWQPIGALLVEVVEEYFAQQNLSLYIPGRPVRIKGMQVSLRMTLIALKRSEPYKVFYRIHDGDIQVILIRHPRQKSIL